MLGKTTETLPGGGDFKRTAGGGIPNADVCRGGKLWMSPHCSNLITGAWWEGAAFQQFSVKLRAAAEEGSEGDAQHHYGQIRRRID